VNQFAQCVLWNTCWTHEFINILMKMLCSIILANIDFDDLKPVMSVTDYALEHYENWKPIYKDYI